MRNLYRRPATPQARRAEMMRAAAMRKRANNLGYSTPGDIMWDAQELARNLSVTDAFIDPKAVEQLQELEELVAVALEWEFEDEEEMLEPREEQALQEMSQAIQELWDAIKEVWLTANEGIGRVRF